MDPAGLLIPALIGGAALGAVGHIDPPVAAAALALAAGLSLLDAVRRRPFWLVAVAAGGVAMGAWARDRALHPALLNWFEGAAADGGRTGSTVLVEGRLAEDAAFAHDGASLRVSVDRVRDAASWHPADGRVQLHVGGAFVAGTIGEWRAGRRIRAPAVLRRPPFVANFGGASLEWQQLRRSFDLTGSVKSASLVDVAPGAWWDECAARVRARVRGAVARFVAPRSPRAAALVNAILIGDRAGLDDEVRERLQAAGTYHVVAISGGNVALVVGAALAFLRLAVRSPQAASAGALATALAYGWIVGGDPSVNRAVSAAVVYLGADLLGLAPSPLAVLRVTAALLVVADPLFVIDVGAWLSFGATLGIVTLTPGLLRPIRRPAIPAVFGPLVRAAAVVVLASVAAELVLAPIAAGVFARVGIAGLVLNLVAIPAMAVVQFAGAAAVVFSSWWPGGAAGSAALARLAADVLVDSSRLVDSLPWLSWRVPSAPLWWTVSYYAAGTLAVLTSVVRRKLIAGAVAGLALLVIISGPSGSASAPVAGRLRVTVLDVGQGDAILAQFPTGQQLLVDAGGGPGSYDVGGRIVTPALWALGARRLDWLAITHDDVDHIGGAASIVRIFRPREIWEGVEVPRDPLRTGVAALARARGVSWRTVRAGARLDVGPVTVEALHPPDPEWERQKTRNDDSLVLRLRYERVEVWLTGDAGVEFEARLPADLASAPVRILKVGHHGSRTSSSERFAQALRPQAAVVSAGRGNLFGHPAPDVLARLERAGAEVFRTDRDGAVIIETDGAAARIASAFGRSWTIVTTRSPRP